ncbi:hypothetical protein Bbelb_189570 [Branchiostoma belcheri]|nr:hypothetical protein Bbelb_189570 [Branchiostoma belcheri]
MEPVPGAQASRLALPQHARPAHGVGKLAPGCQLYLLSGRVGFARGSGIQATRLDGTITRLGICPIASAGILRIAQDVWTQSQLLELRQVFRRFSFRQDTMETSSREDVKGNAVGAKKPPKDPQSIKGRKNRPMGRPLRASSSSTPEKSFKEAQQVQGRARMVRSTERNPGIGSQFEIPSGLGVARRVEDPGREVPKTPKFNQEKAIVSRSSRYPRPAGVSTSNAMARVRDPTLGASTLNRSVSQPMGSEQKFAESVAFAGQHSEGLMTASTSFTPSSVSGPLVPYRSAGDPSQSPAQDSFLTKFRQKYAHLLGRPKPSIAKKEEISPRPQRRLVSTGPTVGSFKPIAAPELSSGTLLPRGDFAQGYADTDSRYVQESSDEEVVLAPGSDVDLEEYTTFTAAETDEDVPTETPPPGGYVNALYLETPATSKSTPDRSTLTLSVDVKLTSPTSPGDPTMRVAESLFQANIKDEQRRQLLRKALAKFQGVLTSVNTGRVGLHFFTVEHLDNFWAKVNLPGAGSVSDRLDAALITDQMRVAVLGRKLAVKVNIDEQEYISVRKRLRKCTTSGIRRTMTLTRSRFAKVTTETDKKEKERDAKPCLTSLLRDEDILKLLRVSKQRDRKIRRLESGSVCSMRQFGMRRSHSCDQIEREETPFSYSRRSSAVGIRAATPPVGGMRTATPPVGGLRTATPPGQGVEKQLPGLTDRLQKMESVLEQIRRLVGQNIDEDAEFGGPRGPDEAQESSLRPDVVRDLEQKTESRRFPAKRESRIRPGDGRSTVGPMGGLKQADQGPSRVMGAPSDDPDITGTELVPVNSAQISPTPSVIDTNRDTVKGSQSFLERLRKRQKSKESMRMKPEDMQIVSKTNEPLGNSDKGQNFVDGNTQLRTWKPKLPSQELKENLHEHMDVQSLDLSGQELKQLPDELRQLADLVRLDLSNNKFKKFPTALLNLPRLEHVNLSRNTLSTFPMETRLMRCLRNLQMTNMALDEMPNELCDLSSLEVLNIRDNNLTRLPRDIGRLKKLTTLQLSWNKFETLSESREKVINHAYIW